MTTEIDTLRKSFTDTRHALGLSIETIVKDMGISYATLVRFEHNNPAKRGFNPHTIYKIKTWVGEKYEDMKPITAFKTIKKIPTKGRIASLDRGVSLVQEGLKELTALLR